jgi:O-antigen ligase
MYADKLTAPILWIVFACSSIVLIEPAPFDVAMLMLCVYITMRGFRIPRQLNAPMSMLGFFLIANVLAAMLAEDPSITIRSLSIRTYLVISWFLLVCLLSSNPLRWLDIVWKGYTAAALVAVGWGFLEFLGLSLIGDSDPWRVQGPFKDPNVFAPFLVPPMIYAFHRIRTGPRVTKALYVGIAGAIGWGILVGFSRGAWVNLILAGSIFGCLSILVAESSRERLRWLLIVPGLLFAGALALAFALSNESIAVMLEHRAQLIQPYDFAAGGRFDTQIRALQHAATDPIGVGPGTTREVFGLEPHNLYLHILVEGGWLAALSFYCFLTLTLWQLLKAILVPTALHSHRLIVTSALIGTLCQSLFIDSTHWRHLWLLLALAWAIIACHRRERVKSGVMSNSDRQIMEVAHI